MQIHELNNFDGNLGSDAFLAIDNGEDTGKVSAGTLLSGPIAQIESAKEELNGRIDNIIAGGDAPSEAEILDARHGANGRDYSSLGAAIRGQVEDLGDDIKGAKAYFSASYECIDSIVTGLRGFYEDTGVFVDTSGWTRFYIPVVPNAEYTLALSFSPNQYSYLCEFDKDGIFIKNDGRVAASMSFTTGPTTFYVGFGCTSNSLVSASLLQKPYSDDIDEKIQTVKNELSESIFQTQGLVTTDYECINSLNTGLIGFYESTGNFVSDSGWTRFYISVNPTAEYTLTLDFTPSQYSYLCEFDKDGNYIKNHGVVSSGKIFYVSEDARYIGFGCLKNSLNAASLIQKIIFEMAEEKINRYRLGTFISSAITFAGGYANYGESYILQNLLTPLSPHMKIAVCPRAGYEYYVVWYDANKNFLNRSEYLGTEKTFSAESASFFRIGIRKEPDSLDPALYDSYIDVYHFADRDDASGLCGDKMRKVFLYGDFVTMTKEDSKNCDVIILKNSEDIISAKAKIKWQGSSSLQFAKKNFTVTFYNADYSAKQNIEIEQNWGSRSKYVLKANYIDKTMSKNVVCAKLYAAMLDERENSTIKTNLQNTPNNGVIDGFPVKVYINDQYAGLYTFNLAKDKYLFGDNIKIFVDAESATDPCRFRAPAIFSDAYWVVEYTDTEDTTDYLDSFNQIYTICMDKATYPDGDAFKNAIVNVVDLPSMIDKMIMIRMCGMSDQESKNQMFGTYDGTKWFTTMYDMDTSFGFNSMGEYIGETEKTSFAHQSTANILMNRLEINFREEIFARYNQLRGSVLSDRNLINIFRGFVARIPQTLFDLEEKLWDIPDPKNDTTEQIIEDLLLSCKELDNVANV